MSNKADETALIGLHELLAKELVDKIRTGKASPADLSVARQFLKDNGINCDGPRNSDCASLVDSLPDFSLDGLN